MRCWDYLQELYVNRAHNDWVESWLEGGLASAAVVCVLVACYVFLAYRSWRAADPKLRLVAYGRAGSICVGLLLAHSIVDYPLRTTALMVMVAISCAFMLRAHLEKATASRAIRSIAALLIFVVCYREASYWAQIRCISPGLR